MVKKAILASLIVFGLVFGPIACFADAEADLEQAAAYRNDGDYEQAESSAGIYTDWSFNLTLNASDCDDGLQGSGSLDRLYVKFTASRDGEEDTKEYDIL